jgi:hypothetical protein
MTDYETAIELAKAAIRPLRFMVQTLSPHLFLTPTSTLRVKSEGPKRFRCCALSVWDFTQDGRREGPCYWFRGVSGMLWDTSAFSVREKTLAR